MQTVIETVETMKTEATKVSAVLIEPLLEYGHAMRAWYSKDQLGQLAKRIVSDEIDVAQLAKLFLSTVVITTLINSVFPAGEENSLEFVRVPLLNDAIVVCSFLVCGVVNALMVFWPLRWAGGVGTFKHTFVAGAYTTAILFPLFTLCADISSLLRLGRVPDAVYAVSWTLSFSQLAAVIHRISIFRAITVSMALNFVVFLIAVVVALSYFRAFR
jgi:hypothetical protein